MKDEIIKLINELDCMEDRKMLRVIFATLKNLTEEEKSK